MKGPRFVGPCSARRVQPTMPMKPLTGWWVVPTLQIRGRTSLPIPAHEPLCGCGKQSTHRLQAFLNAVAWEEVLDFDRSAAELAGRIAGELERVGRPIGLADSMIAAIALEHGLELATGNTTHFQGVPQLGCP